MRRLMSSSGLTILAFTISVFLTTASVSPQFARAQQPSFDVEDPLPSLKRALVHTTTDTQLVEVATALLKAREDMEISYSTFRKGIWEFRTRHPDFYGNFFGDPFYATYDVDYFKMDRLRSLAALEVDPFGELAGMFACNPLGYDPAFGGWCRGFSFPIEDFFLSPNASHGRSSGLLASFPRVQTQSYWRPRTGPRADDGPATFSDTVRTPPVGPDVPYIASRSVDHSDSSGDERSDATEESGVTLDDVQDLIHLNNRVRLPDRLQHEMEEQVENLRRQEAILRLRRIVRERTNGRAALSDREQFELAQEMAERFSSGNRGDLLSQVRRMEVENENRFSRNNRSRFAEDRWRHNPSPERPHRGEYGRETHRVSPEWNLSSGDETTSSEGPTSSAGSGGPEGSTGSSEGSTGS